ncbi:MAG: hypothetical protein BZ137_09575 [Methanosphaera sp. rholeuAM130]|nr:MAG: hypothetical protein BZ137_09575 [Methanosphaera sp. rholeuAM130]
MREISFIDTNVSIAYVFSFDPFNDSSNIIFEEYDVITWSNLVKKEFKKVFKRKQKEIIDLFSFLFGFVEKSNMEFFNNHDLIRTGINDELFKDNYADIKTAIHFFWQKYSFGDLVLKNDLLNAINSYLHDFNIESFNRRHNWLNNVNLSKKRVDGYENINHKLLALGVHEPDNQIILDAHDYNMDLKKTVDFITFDRLCYESVLSVNELMFNNVKTDSDFRIVF